MWLFLHRPFEVWPWIGELRVERVYMIVTITYWALCANKTWPSSRFHFGFLLLALATLASAASSPYTTAGDFFAGNWMKIAVFYVLVVTSVRDERDLRVMVTAFVACFALYMVHSFREYLCGRYVWRAGTPRMVGVDRMYNDPNTFGNSVVYALTMAWPLWSLCSKTWHRWAVTGFVGLGVICILLTGSRSSFAALGVLAVIACALSKYRRTALVCVVLTAPLVWAGLSVELKNRYLTLLDPSYGAKGAQASAEARLYGFQQGFKMWNENPVFGAGLGAFAATVGGGSRPHNLYGLVMGELGTAGVIALSAIVLACVLNMREARRIGQSFPELKNSFLYRTCVAVFVAWLMLLLLGWAAHNMFRYTWLWYGAFQGASIRFLRQQAYALSEDAKREVPPDLQRPTIVELCRAKL
jgi:O-antigen ligase